MEVGVAGTVVVAIRPPQPGKVCLPLAGGTQTFLAFATEEIPRYAPIAVYEVRPDGVDVVRTDVVKQTI